MRCCRSVSAQGVCHFLPIMVVYHCHRVAAVLGAKLLGDGVGLVEAYVEVMLLWKRTYEIDKIWLVHIEHLYHFTHLHRALVVLDGSEGNAGF